MNDRAFLNTPGELLASARQKAGIGMADLSERTKIPVIMLEAVERDEYHRISDPLYVKSFLRAFAAEVGLDPDEILEIYGRMTGSSRAADAPEEVWEEQQVTIRRVGLPWNRILAWAGLVVAVVVVVVFLVRILGTGGDAATEPQSASPPDSTRQVETRVTTPAEESKQIAPVEVDAAAVVVQDSLASGWLAEAPREDTRPEPPAEPEEQPVDRRPVDQAAPTPSLPEELPEESPQEIASVPAQPETVEKTPEPAGTPDPAAGVDALPVATVGGGGLALAAGQPRSQVLRIRTTVPVTASVRRDGERSYTRYHLPGAGRGLPPLPATDIAVGTAYAVQGGVVAYWGARDHFDLVLDRVDGVEISINGDVRDLSRVKPGDEMVLDAFRPSSGQ